MNPAVTASVKSATKPPWLSCLYFFTSDLGVATEDYLIAMADGDTERPAIDEALA